jgi:hypothetical protein
MCLATILIFLCSSVTSSCLIHHIKRSITKLVLILFHLVEIGILRQSMCRNVVRIAKYSVG